MELFLGYSNNKLFFSRPLCSDCRSQGPLSLSMDELERTLGTRMNCSKTSFLNGCKISGLPPNLDLGVKSWSVSLSDI